MNSGEDQILEHLKFDVAGTLRKQGGGRTVIRDSAAAPQRFSGLIHAADGTLAFSGMGITNEWWRLTVTKRRGGAALHTMCLHEWGLFDVDGNRLNKGIGKGPTDLQESDDMSSLENGKVTWPSDLLFQDNNHDIDNMFDGQWYYWAAITGTASGVTPDKIVVAIRLKAGQKPVHSYAFSDNSNVNIPTSWKIETSPDGRNWTTVDEKTDYYAADDRGAVGYYYYWWNDKRWGGAFGLPLTFSYANEETSDVDVAGARVRADAGATVDLTGTKGALTGIEYDAAAGGGTVRAFRAAPNGTVALAGLTRKEAVGLLDLSLPGATDVENFTSWKVTIGGVTKRMVVSYDAAAEKLLLSPGGCMVIVR